MSRRENRKSGCSIAFIAVIIAILIVAIFVGCFYWYVNAIEPVQSNSEKVSVEIVQGSGVSEIAEQLKEAGVIKSATAFKVYCELNEEYTMQAGKYELDKNMSVEEIINSMSSGAVIDETVSITFVEGKNMRWIAETIAEATNNTEDDVYELLEDEEYIDRLIGEYWFLTDEVKDDDIYYPLEGYLYPDTYILADENETVETIFGKMLDKMDDVLSEYEEEIEDSSYSVHEILTLASVVELEAKNDEDRAEVAGVFYNRLEQGMALQSDVTTYYACQIDMDERDLTAAELASDNPYNTRSSSMAGKLPIGPIAMVSSSSIEAVLNPKDTDAIYFVSDINGDVYFSETNAEHEELIESLQAQGLWYSYEED